jgi:rhodanese-related sulfurtransferase
VLFISPSCPACNRSVEAFAALARSAAATGVRLSVVGREPEADLRAWLEAGGIAGAHVVRLQDPAGAGFLVSPTVLVADQTGRVTDFLSGAVKPAELTMLDARLRGLPGAFPPVDDATFAAEIPASELPRWTETTRGQLVDVRNRDEASPPAPAARHIPLDELQPRALVELSRDVPLGVICEPDKIARCRASGRKLRMAGFEEVVVILPAEGPMR